MPAKCNIFKEGCKASAHQKLRNSLVNELDDFGGARCGVLVEDSSNLKKAARAAADEPLDLHPFFYEKVGLSPGGEGGHLARRLELNRKAKFNRRQPPKGIQSPLESLNSFSVQQFGHIFSVSIFFDCVSPSSSSVSMALVTRSTQERLPRLGAR